MNTALILIIGIPLIEIYLFIKIGSQIGALNTVFLILTTAIIGVVYVRYEGFNTLKSGLNQIVKKQVPVYEIISGATLAFAAFLLILPGFATDLIGILLVIPFTRRIILSRFVKKNYSGNLGFLRSILSNFAVSLIILIFVYDLLYYLRQ